MNAQAFVGARKRDSVAALTVRCTREKTPRLASRPLPVSSAGDLLPSRFLSCSLEVRLL